MGSLWPFASTCVCAVASSAVCELARTVLRETSSKSSSSCSIQSANTEHTYVVMKDHKLGGLWGEQVLVNFICTTKMASY